MGDPNGRYNSYSFGVNGNINWRNGLEGEAYRDPMKGGPIYPEFYRKTTPQEDAVIKAYLESQVGTKAAYTPWSTCRNWSQSQFLRFTRGGFGRPSEITPSRNAIGQQPQSIPPLSTTITSSEPFGFLSSSTNRAAIDERKR